MRKRVIWLAYYAEWIYGKPQEEVYAALKKLLDEYPKIDIEVHRRGVNYKYFVRLELPRELAEISDERILSGMDIGSSVFYDEELCHCFAYLRNTPKNIEYDEQETKRIKEYRPDQGRKETS